MKNCENYAIISILMKSVKQKDFKRLSRLFIAAVILSLSFSFVRAEAPVDELQQNISEKQKQLDELNEEINSLQKDIATKQRQSASLKNEISLFDLQIRQTETQIAARALEIQKLADEILQLQIAIQEKQEQIEKQKQFLAETLRLIYEYDSVSPLEITLGNDTFSDFLDQVQYASSLQERTTEVLLEVKRLKMEMEQKQEDLKTSLAEEEAAKQQLEIAQQSLEQQRTGKQALLTQTRGQERVYQSLISEVAKKQEEVAREIFELEVELRRQLGDPTLPPVPGFLRWPASGILSQGYGNTGFTALGYSFHNGVDIAAAPGTKIFAAGDGVVFAVGSGEAAYGNWIVLKHTIVRDGTVNNIYTLYAHLQGFAAASGQAVKAGDLIGYMGNTGNTTRLLYGPERGYHLHFTIFDEKGFSIREGQFQHIYGPYRIPVGITYNPLDFLR